MTGTPASEITLFGLGEAGSWIAADLVRAGAVVHGFDPAPCPTPEGVIRHDYPVAAVRNPAAVLAVTAAEDALTALEQAAETLPPSTLYADLATASPGRKKQFGAVAAKHGLRFVDVALMSTVPGTGIRTPQLVSGPGAQAYRELVQPFGADPVVVGEEAGAAAVRKLLRSVVTKGLAALLIESLEAAEAAGLDEWLWDHLAETLTRADGAFMQRLVEGTPRHAVRRRAEMEAVLELFDELGVAARVTPGVVASLRHVHVATRDPKAEADGPGR